MKVRLVVVWSALLAVALSRGLPVAVAEVAKTPEKSPVEIATPESMAEQDGFAKSNPIALLPIGPEAAHTQLEQSINGRTPEDVTIWKMAQFRLPPRPTQPGQQEQDSPNLGNQPRTLTKFLKYQYTYGSESDITYRRDPDLNKRVKDNSLILMPQANGIVFYRPTDWVETALEMILEREFAVEQDIVVLPNRELQFAPKRELSLLVDQAFVTLKGSTVPVELTFGRRNYEDERHWLYDTSMDVVRAQLKLGQFRAEGTFGREIFVDMDLFKKEVKDRINTTMLYVDYRGIEDTKLAVYTIRRSDRAHQEGRPMHIGARALSAPYDGLKYWAEVAHLTGRDEFSRKISAYGFDVGGTYQFRSLPFSPSLTLNYAFGSGDGNPNDNKNKEFHQTGLQSNEIRFAGVADFKYYGEGLDPELSNLKILTLGLGFRLAPTVCVDLVYHRYRLHRIADAIRNSALTAEINQDDTQLSKDMGSGFDIVLGFRHLFGVRRLGLDLRVGWYFPGKGYRIQEGDPEDPTFRPANTGIGAVAKFWY